MRNTGLKLIAAIVIGLAGWFAYRVIHNAGFSDGWEAGRCYDWKELNEMSQYYGFDGAKISETERESFERACNVVASWSRK